KRAMSRNDFHIFGNELQDMLQSRDHSAHTPPVGHVDEGKSISHEVIPHMHHLRLGKEDNTVPVGVAVGQVESSNVFAIQMHGGAVVEGDHWQGFFWSRLGCIAQNTAASGEALADILVRNDRCFFSELYVAAGVITMKMRVEDELEWLVGDSF